MAISPRFFSCLILFTVVLARSTFAYTRKVSRNNFERSTCPIKCRLDPNTQACVQAQLLSKDEVTVESICTRFLQQRFESASDCETKCGNCEPSRMISKCTKSVLDKRFSICKEAPETGPCRARFTMWYYNPNEGTCKIFYYGGCGGNDNKFNSELECLLRCGLHRFAIPGAAYKNQNQESQSLSHYEL